MPGHPSRGWIFPRQEDGPVPGEEACTFVSGNASPFGNHPDERHFAGVSVRRFRVPHPNQRQSIKSSSKYSACWQGWDSRYWVPIRFNSTTSGCRVQNSSDTSWVPLDSCDWTVATRR
ncbi:hypothetical protein NPIL_435081 [Nephila pilipes]|uniref:Uncharacterized protein n=1 Tax=Nephila pilipes TaxID=299642 RepID=A0A8X6QX11_NEPPI|nr:hypothetical protein NPIL_435081 [Nephila pilipes]